MATLTPEQEETFSQLEDADDIDRDAERELLGIELAWHLASPGAVARVLWEHLIGQPPTDFGCCCRE
jgi:hypothetical protein